MNPELLKKINEEPEEENQNIDTDLLLKYNNEVKKSSDLLKEIEVLKKENQIFKEKCKIFEDKSLEDLVKISKLNEQIEKLKDKNTIEEVENTPLGESGLKKSNLGITNNFEKTIIISEDDYETFQKNEKTLKASKFAISRYIEENFPSTNKGKIDFVNLP